MLTNTYPVGIDIGADTIFVCTPTTRQAIQLADGWHTQLAALVRCDGKTPLIALEPTGRHYSAPIIGVLNRCGAAVIQVDHAITKDYRAAHVGPHKTDAHDADALMRLAIEWADPRPEPDGKPGKKPRGCKLLIPDAEALTSALRATIQGYRRAKKQQTQTLNRLRQLAHHIWPSLGQHLDTYLRAISAGAVTPQQLHALAAGLKAAKKDRQPQAYLDGRARAPLYRLAASIPDDVVAPAMFEGAILMLTAELDDCARKLDGLDTSLASFIHVPELCQVTEAWQTVPRNSTIAIAALHAAAHCQAENYSPDQLRGALGFHPQQHHSGQKEEDEQNMKGYRPARGALHIWTISLLSQDAPPNPIRDYWQQHKEHGHRYAFQAARGKLVRVLAGIAQSGEPCYW
jgi:transposase